MRSSKYFWAEVNWYPEISDKKEYLIVEKIEPDCKTDNQYLMFGSEDHFKADVPSEAYKLTILRAVDL